MKRVFLPIFVGSLVFFPQFAEAQVTLVNPIGETDIRLIVARLITGFLSVSGTIALVMFLYGGILWMTAAGNEGRVKKGKDTLLWAILGIILIASAYVVTNAVFEAVLGTNDRWLN